MENICFPTYDRLIMEKLRNLSDLMRKNRTKM